MQKIEIEIFRELFHEEYPYAELSQLPDKKLSAFLEQKYIKDSTIEMQINFCYDFILSQQLVDIQE